MDKSVRIIIERMKTAKRIKIEFDDLEIMPIHNDKILAHDIALAYQSYAIRREAQARKKESLHKITNYAEEDMDTTGRGNPHPVI